MAERRFLVTGAAGFLGSNLAAALLKRGDSVVGIDNFSQGSRDNLKGFLNVPKFRLLEGDVRDPKTFEGAGGPFDVLIHLAAFKIPRYGGAIDTLTINARGTENVLEFARAHAKRCVIASTSDVYGKNPSLPFGESSDLVVGSPHVKRWAYAVSKMYDEQLAFAYQDAYGLDVTVLRFFGGYGPGEHRSWWGGAPSVFIEQALRGEPLEIHGDGLQRRTFTYVDDLVCGILLAADSERAGGQVINLGSVEETTILDLGSRIWQLVRGDHQAPPIRRVSYEEFKGSYEDVRRRVPDLALARELLGFQTQVSLAEGLPKTIAWHRQQNAASSS